MVYNKDRRHRNRHSSSPGDSGDDESVATSSTSGDLSAGDSGSDGEAGDWQEALFSGIDDLGERVAAKRIAALEKVRRALAHHYSGDELANHVETLLHGVKNLCVRGSAQEQCVAADILGLFMLNFGANQLAESQYREVCDVLEAKLRNAAEGEAGSSGAQELARAVRALGVWKFLTESPQEIARRDGILDQFRDAYLTGRSALTGAALTAAIDAWTLLASALSVSLRNDVVLPRYKALLVQFLNSSNIDVRVASGQALALLYEAQNEVNASEGADGTAAASASADPELQPIIEEFELLVDESSKQHSKKSRSSQKHAFRAFLKTLSEGEAPQERLTVAKHTVSFDGWPQIIALDLVRSLVGQGIAQHFTHNPVVRSLLGLEHSDFDAAAVQKLTSLQKKQLLSKQSTGAKSDREEKNKLTRNARSFSIMHDGENEWLDQ